MVVALHVVYRAADERQESADVGRAAPADRAGAQGRCDIALGVVKEAVDLADVVPNVSGVATPLDQLVEVSRQPLQLSDVAVQFTVLRGVAGVGVDLAMQVAGLPLKLHRESVQLIAITGSSSARNQADHGDS